MNVFISWSDQRSHRIAEGLREWLPSVLHALESWISSEDIDKGAPWDAEMSAQLENDTVGIFCLTPGNLASRWLNFEAGGIAVKLRGKSHVCTYLYGFSPPTEIGHPLGKFQATMAQKEDTKKLLNDTNGWCEKSVSQDVFNKSFEAMWPDFEKVLTEVSGMDVGEVPAPREEIEVLEEIAAGVKTILQRVTGPTHFGTGSLRGGSVVGGVQPSDSEGVRQIAEAWLAARDSERNVPLWTCGTCGTKNRVTRVFCSDCGDMQFPMFDDLDIPGSPVS